MVWWKSGGLDHRYDVLSDSVVLRIRIRASGYQPFDAESPRSFARHFVACRRGYVADLAKRVLETDRRERSHLANPGAFAGDRGIALLCPFDHRATRASLVQSSIRWSVTLSALLTFERGFIIGAAQLSVCD